MTSTLTVAAKILLAYAIYGAALIFATGLLLIAVAIRDHFRDQRAQAALAAAAQACATTPPEPADPLEAVWALPAYDPRRTSEETR